MLSCAYVPTPQLLREVVNQYCYQNQSNAMVDIDFRHWFTVNNMYKR